MASIAGAMPGTWSGVITAAVALTLIAAPIWTALGLHIAKILAERSKAAPIDTDEVAEEHPVLIFGMTGEGRLAADALRDHDIPYIAIDSDPERFVSAASDGYIVTFGDARNDQLVQTLGAAQAKAVVVSSSAIPQPMTHGNPPRFVIAADAAERATLAALGVNAYIAHAAPHGIELATDLLRTLGIDQAAITTWVSEQAEARGLSFTPEKVAEVA